MRSDPIQNEAQLQFFPRFRVAVCAGNLREELSKWVLGLIPVSLAIVAARSLPAWLWMWLLVLALFLGAKWITVAKMLSSAERPKSALLICYCLLWPGMDPRAFCGNTPGPSATLWEWMFASGKTLFGAGVLWGGARFIGRSHPLVTGWVAMLGIVFVLHFGLFHVLSLVWRAFGVNAQPIMRWPIASTSISTFWGGRWNSAFRDLMHDLLFKASVRKLGVSGAIITTFLASGFLHDLVISIPAGGGYGLPSLYFVLQGVCVLFERSNFGRRLGLGCGLKGWFFAVLVVGAPAFWLFHPAFICKVILPMCEAIGAI